MGVYTSGIIDCMHNLSIARLCALYRVPVVLNFDLAPACYTLEEPYNFTQVVSQERSLVL